MMISLPFYLRNSRPVPSLLKVHFCSLGNTIIQSYSDFSQLLDFYFQIWGFPILKLGLCNFSPHVSMWSSDPRAHLSLLVQRHKPRQLLLQTESPDNRDIRVVTQFWCIFWAMLSFIGTFFLSRCWEARIKATELCTQAIKTIINLE